MIEKDHEANLDKNLISGRRIKTEQQQHVYVSDTTITSGQIIWTSGVNKQLITSGGQKVHSLLHMRTVVQAAVWPVVAVEEETKMLVTVTVSMPAETMSYFLFRHHHHQPLLIFGGKIQIRPLENLLQEKPEFVIVPLAVQITIPGCPYRPRHPHRPPAILRWTHPLYQSLGQPLGSYPGPHLDPHS